MIHAAVFGSFERFIGIITEHYAGAFPLWLSPVQAMIIPVSEKFNRYGEKILEKLKENNVRVEMDNSDESLGKRIHAAEKQKIPYIVIVGEKEEKSKSLSVRGRDKEQKVLQLEEFIPKIQKEIAEKK